MKPRNRVLLAGLFHETHTFLDGLTRLEECQILTGEELLGASGDLSPLSGVIEAGKADNWDIVPAIDIRAMPGPVVADEVVDRFWSAILAAIPGATLTEMAGVMLVLHGAMVSESLDDVEGEILRRLRDLSGGREVPIGGVLDMHGNFTRDMADSQAAMICYRKNPHIDARESAMDAAAMLTRMMESGERPVTVWEHVPVMWPPTGTGTATGPVAALEEMAREVEAESSEILAVNVLPGFAFSDIQTTGLSFTGVTTGNPVGARSDLSRLAAYAVEHREDGNIRDQPLDALLAGIRDMKQGPLVIAEPADNIGAGAPGDCTAVLRGFIEHKMRDCAVVINDPEAAARVRERGPGDTLRIAIGGKGWRQDPGPVVLDVTVERLTDGRFELEDPQSHLASMLGSVIEMGPCAVVRHGGVTILLTSRKTPPFDLGQLRSQGIIPESLFAVGVKAAVAHRRAYDPIARAHFSVETPGPCSSNLRTLPYRKVRRPVFPLDSI